jgi:hypothetical protein
VLTGCGTVFGREVGKLGAWTSEEVAVVVEGEDSSSDVAVEVSDVSESVESVGLLAESRDLSEVRSESDVWVSPVSELVELDAEEVSIEVVDEMTMPVVLKGCRAEGLRVGTGCCSVWVDRGQSLCL